MAALQHPARRQRWLGAVGVVAFTVGFAVTGQPAVRAGVPLDRAPAAAAFQVAAPAATAGAAAGGSYAALTPARILDTRSGLGGHGTVEAGQTVDLQVDGRGGVPASGVSAVVVQVTSTGQSSSGFVTAYPSLVARPVASNLDFLPGVDTSNLVTVPVGTNGRIELFNASSGTNQLIADVQGYFIAGVATAPGAFRSLTPARILDTRSHIGATGKVAAQGTIGVQVTGRGGVPATGVSAVAVNVTVAAPTQPGFITGYPSGADKPVASDLNFAAGQTIANLVIVPVGAGGRINLFNGSSGQTHLIADVQGYFMSGSTFISGGYRSLTPTRILDTRSGLGGSTRVAAHVETKVHVDGYGGVPASGVSAVVLDVTGVRPSALGSLVAYPTGVLMPLASNLNYFAGQNRANLVIVPVDAFGWISLKNNSAGSIDELADVAGYFVGEGVEPTVLGSYSYGPFTMGMTIAQAKVAYPALNPTFYNSTSCGEAVLPMAHMTFNHGTNQLSFVTASTPTQTADGIHLQDTLGSVVSRFPWATIIPDEPQMKMAVSRAELAKAVQTTYWFSSSGPRDPVTDLPYSTDKIGGMSLERDERCFD